MVQATNLSKSFERIVRLNRQKVKQEFLAVDNVSITAKEGEIIGILGPNGAGKTTLLRMLGMLMSPTSGEIIFTDKDKNIITDIRTKKKEIGYLSENTKLYQRFSIKEYLHFLGELYNLSEKENEERIDKITEILHMEDFADNHIGKLSTGQTQRASIARCLMADPSIYILDEPTLGLDIISSEAILDFMKAQKDKGKTVLYSTHYLEEAQMLCDRIYMLLGGRIVASGTVEEIKAATDSYSLREAFLQIYDSVLKEGKVCLAI